MNLLGEKWPKNKTLWQSVSQPFLLATFLAKKIWQHPQE
jgi:hypothetical protein